MPARHQMLEPKLSQWLEASAKGDSLPLEELCRECPELIPELASELESRGVPFYSLSKAPPQTDAQVILPVGPDAPTPLPRSWLQVTPGTPTDPLGTLGGYHLLKVLGEGGMGTVYLAYDPLARRHLALKTMRPEIAMRPIARERFIREARSAAGLDHDHIVPIYQVGEERNIPFIAMPFLQGESLETRQYREPMLPLNWILKLAREAAEGLVVAHDQGVIHRDIKPANIFLATVTRSGSGSNSGKLPPLNELLKPEEIRNTKVKILDFGLARPVESSENFTQPGTLIGTPGYMSPEQVDGLAIDPRSDLFSLGCVLYHMATGQPPFQGATLTAVLRATAERNPRRVEEYNPGLPLTLCDLIHKLLAKDREQRPATAEEVVETIREIEEEWSIATDAPRSSKRTPALRDILPPAAEPEDEAPEKTRTTVVIGMLVAIIITVITIVFAMR